MRPATARFLLRRVMGWSYDDGAIEEPKAIVLGFPHTCAEDFLVFYLYTRAIGEKMHVMMKKEFYKWPLRRAMKAIGIVPVDRSHGAGVLKQCVDIFNSSERFHIAICPEGTRKAVKRWKTGFHTLASATGAGVYPGYFDWKNKYITRGKRFELTEDSAADLRAIQKYYRDETPASGKYPEKVAFPDDL